MENDFEIERRPNEIASTKEKEPYSVVTFNPAEIIHIERQIYAQLVESEDLDEYKRFKTELPDDLELRKKYLQSLEWSKFKSENHINSGKDRQKQSPKTKITTGSGSV